MSVVGQLAVVALQEVMVEMILHVVFSCREGQRQETGYQEEEGQ